MASVAESAGLSFWGKEDKRKGLELVGGMRMVPNPSGCPCASAAPGRHQLCSGEDEATLLVVTRFSVTVHCLFVQVDAMCAHPWVLYLTFPSKLVTSVFTIQGRWAEGRMFNSSYEPVSITSENCPASQRVPLPQTASWQGDR